MATPSLTSRLDAVNTILSACGEQPVSSLGESTPDAVNAETILDEVSREVQSEGWHFNTEADVPLTPDTQGHITLPLNVANVDTTDNSRTDIDPVQRGTRLYDRKARSYVFRQPVKAEIVYLLAFEELPEPARRYIAVRAARVFHDRFVGSETQHRFTSEDETRARLAIVSANLRNADANFFTSNPTFFRTG